MANENNPIKPGQETAKPGPGNQTAPQPTREHEQKAAPVQPDKNQPMRK